MIVSVAVAGLLAATVALTWVTLTLFEGASVLLELFARALEEYR